MQGNLLYTKATNKQNKTKQKTSSKWIDSSSEGHLQDFSSISQDFSSKIVIERGVKGQIKAYYLSGTQK